METQDILFQYLKDIIYNPDEAVLNIEELPAEFQKLGQAMLLLGKWIEETREFSVALAKGDLSNIQVDKENIIIAPMKELQATLRHLAWQTQQVAKGDYSQKLDFMGEFSEAFNTMTRQLDERRQALIEETRRVELKNEELERARKREEALMYRFAYTDALTHLYNRRYAMEEMERLLEQREPFVLSFVDVDYLKYCNDTYGHHTGDVYLMEIADALGHVGGVLCRIGGDEFMIIATEKTPDEQNLLLGKVREALIKDGKNSRYPKSFSYASCEIPAKPDKSLDEYILMADTMMYEFKTKNKLPLRDALYRDERRLHKN